MNIGHLIKDKRLNNDQGTGQKSKENIPIKSEKKVANLNQDTDYFPNLSKSTDKLEKNQNKSSSQQVPVQKSKENISIKTEKSKVQNSETKEMQEKSLMGIFGLFRSFIRADIFIFRLLFFQMNFFALIYRNMFMILKKIVI